MVSKSKNCEYSKTFRNKDIDNYRAYDRSYKAERYNNPEIRAKILMNLKLKYYYAGDPLTSIRKLFILKEQKMDLKL